MENKTDKMRIVFMGTPNFAVPSLLKLIKAHNVVSVYTQPPRASGRGMKVKISPINKTALENNIPVKVPVNFNSKEDKETLLAFNPDFLIVVAYGILLPKNILNIPKFLPINGHASQLPRWRGAAPIHRAIESGDKNTAVSAMLMEETLDTGPVIKEYVMPIFNDDTYSSLHDRMSIEMPDVLIESINLISQNKIKPTKQSLKGITYAKKLTQKETIIKWDESLETILRKIRAFTPWPGCWTFHQNNRIRVHTAIPLNISFDYQNLNYGQIAMISQSGCPVVLTGDKKFLELVELQKEGKNKLHGSEFLRGYSIKQGDILNMFQEKA